MTAAVIKSADAWAGPLITLLLVIVLVLVAWWLIRVARRFLAQRRAWWRS